MELKWYQSEATHEVSLLDTGSSPTTVFLRRNITKTTKKIGPKSEETYDVWQYEEAKVSHEQFEEYVATLQTKARSDIDFIAMMTGVDLDE